MLRVYRVTQTGSDFPAGLELFIRRLQHLAQHHLGPCLIVLGLPTPFYQALAK